MKSRFATNYLAWHKAGYTGSAVLPAWAKVRAHEWLEGKARFECVMHVVIMEGEGADDGEFDGWITLCGRHVEDAAYHGQEIREQCTMCRDRIYGMAESLGIVRPQA